MLGGSNGFAYYGTVQVAGKARRFFIFWVEGGEWGLRTGFGLEEGISGDDTGFD